MEFTAEEKELLIAAAKSGQFGSLSIQDRTWVTAGGKDFPDDPENCDPAIIAKYSEAYESLCNREFINRESNMLTVSGFKIARELAEEEE